MPILVISCTFWQFSAIQVLNSRNKTKSIAIERPSPTRMFSPETSLENIRPLDLEENELECREKSLIIALMGFFS